MHALNRLISEFFFLGSFQLINRIISCQYFSLFSTKLDLCASRQLITCCSMHALAVSDWTVSHSQSALSSPSRIRRRTGWAASCPKPEGRENELLVARRVRNCDVRTTDSIPQLSYTVAIHECWYGYGTTHRSILYETLRLQYVQVAHPKQKVGLPL